MGRQMMALFFMGHPCQGLVKTCGIFPISEVEVAKQEISIDSNNKQFHPFLTRRSTNWPDSTQDLITLGSNLACNRSPTNVFHLHLQLSRQYAAIALVAVPLVLKNHSKHFNEDSFHRLTDQHSLQIRPLPDLITYPPELPTLSCTRPTPHRPKMSSKAPPRLSQWESEDD